MANDQKNKEGPDFIGVGAQKSGTSWIYSCLYEHPEIYIRVKEIHFFSRERNWSKGRDWYENFFSDCPPNCITGEYSTSYLYDEKTPKRIYNWYPQTKIIACLRNPVDRAYSNYLNDIKGGDLSSDLTFSQALKDHPEYVDQGMYAKQLKRFYSLFPKEQVLVLIYENIRSDPKQFIQLVYKFLGVDSTFVPSMLKSRVNVARIPKSNKLEKFMNKISLTFQKIHLDRLVWAVKKTGIPQKIRQWNTVKNTKKMNVFLLEDQKKLKKYFKDEIQELSKMLNRKISEWQQ